MKRLFSLFLLLILLLPLLLSVCRPAQPAADCAAKIRSRASLWLAEHR